MCRSACLCVSFFICLGTYLCAFAYHRKAKDKVQDYKETALGFLGAYYEDHIQPVSDSYLEWALGFKSAVLEKLQTTIHNYTTLNLK